MTVSTTTEVHIEVAEEHVWDNVKISKIRDTDELHIYEFEYFNTQGEIALPISLKWKIPGLNVKGVWKPTNDFSKRIQADWELRPMKSSISIDAPVICVFGHDDLNVITFACNDAIHPLELDAVLREEDNCLYCHVKLFSQAEPSITNYKVQLRLDFGKAHFSDSLKNVSRWWETFEDLKPTPVPYIAKQPVYSTWYQFHQDLDEEVLLKECEMASEMGYMTIIVDDGWQTKDSNRGYDYTGDWRPERIPEMESFVKKIHGLGMKVALWYSVPFCGKKSKAYQRFKGKFLTENHRWAPVFDPRYPEVREYLIELYTSALKDWKLDGFKLDFIDDFHRYDDTPVGAENGRDHASIDEAVDRLLSDIISRLRKIKTDVFVEFRQKYTGPAMRKYGNMFRAFDCPGDAVMNRVRIADIKMLCGNTAVHSDMVTWHHDERVEVAALQLINVLFGVPQLSIMLQKAPKAHLKMIRFYTKYWNDYSDILLNGDFRPSKPLANYPIHQAVKDDYTIVGIHDQFVVSLETATKNIHFLNAQLAQEIVIKASEDYGRFKGIVFDCQGNPLSEKTIELRKGVTVVQVPPCGVVQLTGPKNR